jgi:hypothetical protein
VLRFTALWDDRDKLYGDLLTFRIHYFLADDTIEVRENTIHCTRTEQGSCIHSASTLRESQRREGPGLHDRSSERSRHE